MLRTAALIGALLGLTPISVWAALIINTGEPASPPAESFILRNTPAGQFQFLAAEFSLTQAYTITGVQGWIAGGGDAGEGGPLTIAIYNDGGEVPGTTELFATIVSVENPGAGWVGPGDPGDLDWALGPGTFWVAFEFRSFFATGTMPSPSPSPLGNEAFQNQDSNGWSEQDSLNLGVRIFGDPSSPNGVPEPSSLLLGLLAFALAFAHRRRA
jgi:MYXO-CTERM domain-containing protein